MPLVMNLYVVVLSELPRNRETLLLRLLGSHEMRKQALAEIHEIPKGDPDFNAMISLLTYVQGIIERDPRIPHPEKEDIMTAMRQEFERFRQSLRQEGVHDTKVHYVLTVLAARGIPVNDNAQAQIAACEDGGLLDTWLKRAAIAERIEDVLLDKPAETT